jgi:glutamyl-tRNA reductase
MPADASSPPASIEVRIFVTGANHRTAGQELRDALFVDAKQLPSFYEHLHELGVDEAMVLATCDRVMVTGLAAEPEVAQRRVRTALAEAAGIADARLDNALFTLHGADALDHLFAIASSLESQVVGEPEVLGQVKDAYRRGAELGAVGGGLGRVLDAALACAKRARTETAIGECAVSIVSAAAQVAREVLGRFDGARALIIGGAEIGVTLIERLKGEGLDQITVADPLAPRGEALAARLGAHRLGMADVPGRLAGFDIVVTGLGGREPVLRGTDVDVALRARRFRPVFLLDAAVPPDIDRAVRGLDDAYLFDLHDLERIALTGQEKRSQATAEARNIVEDEVAHFLAADSGRRAAPVVAELRAHFEDVREGVLREQPGISADEATRLLVNRLLHAPSRALRDIAADRARAEKGGEPSAEAGLIQRLFGLARRGTKDEKK